MWQMVFPKNSSQINVVQIDWSQINVINEMVSAAYIPQWAYIHNLNICFYHASKYSSGLQKKVSVECLVVVTETLCKNKSLSNLKLCIEIVKDKLASKKFMPSCPGMQDKRVQKIFAHNKTLRRTDCISRSTRRQSAFLSSGRIAHTRYARCMVSSNRICAKHSGPVKIICEIEENTLGHRWYSK